MTRTVARAALVATLSLWAAPASPHHSFTVAFDEQRPVSIEGVVTEVKWENPHSWIFVETKRPDGASEQWRFETQPPNTLRRNGVTAALLKPGARVTIKGYGAHDRPSTAAAASLIVFSTGETFRISAGGTPPPKEGQ
ncbi:MAG: hypothetical protein HYY76_09770 [Acidobacteria bacterium]|nr:hypothetical protein [Acidobacteriota bacterium]